MSTLRRREPVRRPAPPARGLAVEEQGPLDPGGPRVYVHREALERTLAHGREATDRERGGFLIGTPAADEAGPYAEADAWLPAEASREGPGSLRLGHATWEALHRTAEARWGADWTEERAVLGWHHTHPGHGVFLSAADRFIQERFFDAPWQFALVVDPLADELAAFGWRDEAIVRTGVRVVGGPS